MISGCCQLSAYRHSSKERQRDEFDQPGKREKNLSDRRSASHALKGLSLTIEREAFVSFIGPSGSGKSTLLNLIGSLDKPTEGKVIVDDVDIAALGRPRSAAFRGNTMGFVFQNFNLIPVLKVFENVMLPLAMSTFTRQG